MSFPLELFIEKSKNEGRSEEFIKATESYAKNLMEKGLPVIFSIPHLAMEIGVRSDDLKSMIDDISYFNYTYFFLRKKRKGAYRQIAAPKEKLKFTQRWINFNILQKINYNQYITGFAPGTSILQNAKIHQGSKFLLKIDLLKFFDSIAHERVYDEFKAMGYVKNLAHDLASICTVVPRTDYWDKFTEPELEKFQIIRDNEIRVLPQGAPTSPLLANLVATNLDLNIAQLSAKMGFKYSRYADDLCFSADLRSMLPKIKTVVALIEKEGFFVNENKIKLSAPGRRQYVTGLSIANNKVSVKKSKRKEVFGHLYYIKKWGLESHLQHLKSIGKYHHNFQNWLFGHISFHYSIDKKVGARMLEMYNRINWDIDSNVSKIKSDEQS